MCVLSGTVRGQASEPACPACRAVMCKVGPVRQQCVACYVTVATASELVLACGTAVPHRHALPAISEESRGEPPSPRQGADQAG